jgi:outer membrane biosynthesis protein TonB
VADDSSKNKTKPEQTPEIATAQTELVCAENPELPEKEMGCESVERFDSALKDPGAAESEWIPALINWSREQETSKPKERQRLGDHIMLLVLASLVAVTFMRFVGINPLHSNTVGHCGSQPNYSGYIRKMEERIKKQWHPGKHIGQAVAHFKIHRDGSISSLGLTETAFDEAFNLSTQKAVEAAAPFDDLPQGAPESVDVDYTFIAERRIDSGPMLNEQSN